MNRIPRHIHQLWNDENPPPRYLPLIESWKRHNPAWKYTLWTHAAVRELISTRRPELLPVFDGYAKPICRADLGRYVVLAEFGGIYADLDTECLRPIDPLLEDTTGLVLADEPAEHLSPDSAAGRRGFMHLPCPAFIASTPGHEFWKHLFVAIRITANHPDPLDATGPFLLGQLYDVPIVTPLVTRPPTELVYPFAKDDCWSGRIRDEEFWNRRTRHAFLVHYWEGTWFKGELPTTLGRGAPAGVESPQQLVSCLMVTRCRGGMVRQAIECFLRQTYPDRELVLLTEQLAPDLATLIAPHASIRAVEVGHRGLTLGALRNLAVRAARGQLVAQWDDDDLHHPERLSAQVNALRQARADACLLNRWKIWWPGEHKLATSVARPWEGSILAVKSALPDYPDLRRGEDTPVIEKLLRQARVVLLDAPHLYVYRVHGENTFHSAHFAQHWQVATERFEGEAYRVHLAELAKSYPTLDLQPQG
jgi:hypothetical protein